MKKLSLVLLIVLTAISASAQKVKVGSDPAANLAKYKTYAWDKPLPPGNPLVQQTIIDAVDQAMAAKGLTKVESQPDITVAYFAAVDTDIQIAYPGWGNAMGTALSTGIAVNSQSWPVSKGTLVIDIADTGTKSTVWRGSATHTLEHSPTGNPAKNAKSVEKPIRKSVDKMFKQFPRPS